jgi:hypothetical protein
MARHDVADILQADRAPTFKKMLSVVMRGTQVRCVAPGSGQVR